MEALNIDSRCIKIFLLIFYIGILSCEPEIITKVVPKERECIAESASLYYPGDMIFGRVSGLKNCLPFLAEAKAFVKNDSIILEVQTFDHSQFLNNPKEKLKIGSKVHLDNWTSKIDSILTISIAEYSILDHSIIEDNYSLNPNYEYNKFVLNSVDSKEKHIKGRFECQFILNSINPSGINPDTIIFWDCRFDAKTDN